MTLTEGVLGKAGRHQPQTCGRRCSSSLGSLTGRRLPKSSCLWPSSSILSPKPKEPLLLQLLGCEVMTGRRGLAGDSGHAQLRPPTPLLPAPPFFSSPAPRRPLTKHCCPLSIFCQCFPTHVTLEPVSTTVLRLSLLTWGHVSVSADVQEPHWLLTWLHWVATQIQCATLL